MTDFPRIIRITTPDGHTVWVPYGRILYIKPGTKADGVTFRDDHSVSRIFVDNGDVFTSNERCDNLVSRMIGR